MILEVELSSGFLYITRSEIQQNKVLWDRAQPGVCHHHHLVHFLVCIKHPSVLKTCQWRENSTWSCEYWCLALGFRHLRREGDHLCWSVLGKIPWKNCLRKFLENILEKIEKWCCASLTRVRTLCFVWEMFWGCFLFCLGFLGFFFFSRSILR